jgi:hypothetical protein
VATGRGSDPNFWGPLATAKDGQQEPYKEAAGGQRPVQYFDKGRMEITTGALTNGLLATELIRGQIQVGDATFQMQVPPAIPIAGDPDSPRPTYAQLASRKNQGLFDAAPQQTGNHIQAGVSPAGDIVVNDTGATTANTFTAFDGATKHNVPRAFVDYRAKAELLTIGYALCEPFRTTVKVAGQQKDVMVQVFERRVLTYTASNPAAFQVEMGNIGQHYHQWRYAGTPISNPPSAEPLQQRIAAGERTWRQAGITSYRITVKKTLGGIAVITDVIVATVRDGAVVDQQLVQCTIGDWPCPPNAKLDPNTDVSIPGLFAYARANATNPNIDMTIEFDPTYGFPRAIRTALRNANDAAAGVVVTQFEPLP